MKILYIECNMGAAGDMLMSALSELIPDADAFVEKMNNLHIPSVSFEKNKTKKCGIAGTHINVTVDGISEDEHIHEHHCHTGMSGIEHIINHLSLSDKVRADVLSVYNIIAEAESSVHECDIKDIHFHEVGTADAVADITGVCTLIEEIAPDKIIVSPIHVGSGTVKCAHGILPVPAPATAYILKDVPIYGGKITGELCTPTGAALLKHFADGFGEMPLMRVSRIGYGMGTKDFDTANCVRVMLGETGEEPTDKIYELSCNIDDMTGEEIGYAVNILMKNGALDVFSVPVNMKKSRPGILLVCLCKPDEREKLARLIFKYTSTIGVREKAADRYILDRRTETIHSEYGDMRVKISEGYGVKKQKYEYDDIAAAAEKYGLSPMDIRRNIEGGGRT